MTKILDKHTNQLMNTPTHKDVVCGGSQSEWVMYVTGSVLESQQCFMASTLPRWYRGYLNMIVCIRDLRGPAGCRTGSFTYWFGLRMSLAFNWWTVHGGPRASPCELIRLLLGLDCKTVYRFTATVLHLDGIAVERTVWRTFLIKYNDCYCCDNIVGC